MPINERTMNGYIAVAMELLAPPDYTVDPENTEQGKQPGTTPDLVVRMPYGLRTIIETEYGAPAIADAKKRLGYELIDSSIPMKSVIALGIPRELGNMRPAAINDDLMSDKPQFLMQVVTGKCPDDPDITYVPDRDNPVPVSLQDLVQYAWLAAIPEAYSKKGYGRRDNGYDRRKKGAYGKAQRLRRGRASPSYQQLRQPRQRQ